MSKKYIVKILEKFMMMNCKPVVTLGIKLSKYENPETPNASYQNLIGGLMYLEVATRPDIAHYISYLSQFHSYFDMKHCITAKRKI